MDSRSLGGSRDNHRSFFSRGASLTIVFIFDNNVNIRHTCQGGPECALLTTSRSEDRIR